MKKARKINAIIWATIAAVITGMVCYYWIKSGCGFGSLVFATIWYCGSCFALGFTIDQTIADK